MKLITTLLWNFWYNAMSYSDCHLESTSLAQISLWSPNHIFSWFLVKNLMPIDNQNLVQDKILSKTQNSRRNAPISPPLDWTFVKYWILPRIRIKLWHSPNYGCDTYRSLPGMVQMKGRRWHHCFHPDEKLACSGSDKLRPSLGLASVLLLPHS